VYSEWALIRSHVGLMLPYEVEEGRDEPGVK
jgi:hypothetical protein